MPPSLSPSKCTAAHRQAGSACCWSMRRSRRCADTAATACAEAARRRENPNPSRFGASRHAGPARSPRRGRGRNGETCVTLRVMQATRLPRGRDAPPSWGERIACRQDLAIAAPPRACVKTGRHHSAAADHADRAVTISSASGAIAPMIRCTVPAGTPAAARLSVRYPATTSK
jgi:hypothetical protein